MGQVPISAIRLSKEDDKSKAVKPLMATAFHMALMNYAYHLPIH
jgi:hypothetical protein